MTKVGPQLLLTITCPTLLRRNMGPAESQRRHLLTSSWRCRDPKNRGRDRAERFSYRSPCVDHRGKKRDRSRDQLLLLRFAAFRREATHGQLLPIYIMLSDGTVSEAEAALWAVPYTDACRLIAAPRDGNCTPRYRFCVQGRGEGSGPIAAVDQKLAFWMMSEKICKLEPFPILAATRKCGNDEAFRPWQSDPWPPV